MLSKRKTKIIVTLGPASDSPRMIRKLIRSGANIFRINASHITDSEQIDTYVTRVRDASDELNAPVGVFVDLQGPKIRVGSVSDEFVKLKKGQIIELTTDDIEGDSKRISVSYKNFHEDVQVGQKIFIDDGQLRMRAIEKKDRSVLCKVMLGGNLSSRKGVNLPTTQMEMSAMTQKDERDAIQAIKSRVDFIALSFVTSKADVEKLRNFIKLQSGYEPQIIAKIERQLAVDNIREIVEATDAVMVARGDLGVEIGVEKVPKAQKAIIIESNRQVKPVIVATQMLESMIHSATATRAEVSDVANAVYENCDAVMLSGETAMGNDPARVVKMMHTICLEADDYLSQIKRSGYSYNVKFDRLSQPISICRAADLVAEENLAHAMVSFTSSGNTPRIASKLRPSILIIAPTDQRSVYNQLSLVRGVVPLMMPVPFCGIRRWTEMINLAIEEAKRIGYLKVNQKIVVTAGRPIGISNGINSIRIVTID